MRRLRAVLPIAGMLLPAVAAAQAPAPVFGRSSVAANPQNLDVERSVGYCERFGLAEPPPRGHDGPSRPLASRLAGGGGRR
jgi:hypothetical protein